jgi:transcriptional regulator with XRE-family HTH domain
MNRIKEVLKKQGRTQAFLCRKLDRSKNTISLWCRNEVQPSVNDLYRIAKLLDCKVAYLLLEEYEIALLKKRIETKKVK